MKLINKISTSKLVRLAASIALIFFYHKLFKNLNLVTSLILFFILFLEIFLLLTKETWWSNIKYIIFYFLIISLAVISKFSYNTDTSTILYPAIWILGSLERKYDKLSMLLASLITIIIFLMSPISYLSFQSLFALIGIFFGIRSIKIRKEAYKKLEEAHSELLQSSVTSMKYAALEERTRLSREIHDGIGHQLTSLIVQLQALELMLPNDPKEASKLVSQLLQISRNAMAEVRIAVKEWSDDEMGLGLIALKGLISQTQARSSIQFSFCEDSEISEWSMETSTVLYRILQESLTNILRHSNANSAQIHMSEINDNIILLISDDGKYIGDTPLKPGFGISGIVNRCESLGGTCSITPNSPHGLKVQVIIPCNSTNYKE
ncbi:sensor histidine kinase [Clostridium felsineum]|nr:sensor histidine kinase [Clostridium felsineum]